jgi:hypothetical protein
MILNSLRIILIKKLKQYVWQTIRKNTIFSHIYLFSQRTGKYNTFITVAL